MKGPDFNVSMEGSLCRITPRTAKARKWISQNCEWESWQIVGDSFVADRRYFKAIADGLDE